MTNQTLIKTSTGPFAILHSTWRFLKFLGWCGAALSVAFFALCGLGLVAHAIWFAITIGWHSFKIIFAL